MIEIWESMERISFDKYVEKLKRDYSVYGGFLRYFTLQIGDLPKDIGVSLLKVGMLYEELNRIKRNMLDAYIKYAFLKAGYVSKELWKIAEEEEEDIRELTMMFINSLLLGEMDENEGNYEDYVNLENPEESLHILIISFEPYIIDDEVSIGWWSEYRTNYIVDEFSKYDNFYIVIDPLLYYLAGDYIEELKKRIKEEWPKSEGKILYVDKLIEIILDPSQRKDLEEDWEKMRDKTITNLKKKYPFLYNSKFKLYFSS